METEAISQSNKKLSENGMGFLETSGCPVRVALEIVDLK